jgi:hypothetical protein
MQMLPATVASAQFLTHLRQCHPTAPPDPALEQSIHAWLSYYHALQTVRGGYTPLTVAVMQAQFYPCAQALLDEVAETVRCFFQLPGTRAAWFHARLTQEFPRLCVAYQLTGETQSVSACLLDLQARIVDARPPSPAAALDTLRELVTCIEQYIVVLLHWLAQNIAHYHVPL